MYVVIIGGLRYIQLKWALDLNKSANQALNMVLMCLTKFIQIASLESAVSAFFLFNAKFTSNFMQICTYCTKKLQNLYHGGKLI